METSLLQGRSSPSSIEREEGNHSQSTANQIKGHIGSALTNIAQPIICAFQTHETRSVQLHEDGHTPLTSNSTRFERSATGSDDTAVRELMINGIGDGKALAMLQQFPNLEHLEALEVDPTVNGGYGEIGKLKQLQSIAVWQGPTSSEDMNHLTSQNSLRHLWFIDNFNNFDSLFLPNLSRFDNILSLSIGSTVLKMETVRTLLDKLQHLRYLEFKPDIDITKSNITTLRKLEKGMYLRLPENEFITRFHLGIDRRVNPNFQLVRGNSSKKTT